jgi:hypothetical protein
LFVLSEVMERGMLGFGEISPGGYLGQIESSVVRAAQVVFADESVVGTDFVQDVCYGLPCL